MKKIVTVLTVAFLMFSAFGCGGSKTSGKNDVTVWTCSANTKILRDASYDMQTRELEINAFKNESESAQIIITPTDDVADYTLALSDLKAADGSVLNKENFTVYNEKYISVTTVKNINISITGGYYPDALLPFEKAVEYGENKINGGNNQGIYITVKVPENQKSGVYTGNFTVTADGREFTVPVSVTVYDFTVPTATRVKSSYGILANEIAYGELDTSYEMYEKYYDFLLDYRICGQDLPYRGTLGNFNGGPTESVIDGWVDSALKYALDERCSYYNLIFSQTNVSGAYYEEFDGTRVPYTGIAVDVEAAEKIYDALFLRSMKEGVNLFKKLGSYLVLFDEAEVNGKMDMANYCLYAMNEKQKECVEKYKTDPAFAVKADDKGDEAFRTEIIKSLSEVKHKFTGAYTDSLKVPGQYVPTIDCYDTATERNRYKEIDREYYGENGELWAYHCMNPLAPYPTAHIDDEILSSRIMGWMMQSYGITGSLYWDVNLYAYRTDNVNNLQLTDYYDTALRFPFANGDGFLLYPGAPYGIYGPVPSIRLAALRDGFEDYDVLCALEEMYAENGVGADEFAAVAQILYSRLFSGAKVKHGAAVAGDFDEVRGTVAELIAAAKEGIVISDCTETEAGTEFTVKAPAGTVVKSGSDVLSGTADGNRVVFAVTVARDGNRNELKLTAEISGRTFGLNVYVGGKRKVVSADGYAAEAKNGSDRQGADYDVETTEIDGKPAISVKSDAQIAEDERKYDYLEIALKPFGVNSATQKIVLNIYNNGAESMEIDLYVQADEKNAAAIKVDTFTLEKGWNAISADISVNAQNKTLANLRIMFSGPAAIDIALGDIIVSE